jgi:hypothetical protein
LAVVLAAATVPARGQGVPWDVYDDPQSPSRCDVVGTENFDLVVLAATGELVVVNGTDRIVPGSFVETDGDVYIDGEYAGFIEFDYDGEGFRTLWWFDPTGAFITYLDPVTLTPDFGDLRPFEFVDVPCSACPFWDEPLAACGEIEFEILLSPEGRTVCEGDDVVLNVVTYGNVLPEFQWFRDGAPIANATDDVLVINNISFFGEGEYDVEVYVDGLVLVSEPALLLVEDCDPTRIIGHPADDLACVGDDVVFGVDVTGSRVAGFQWYHNGRPIPQSDADTIIIESVTLSDDGLYEVDVILDDGSRLISNLAELVVDSCQDFEIVKEPMDQDICEGEDLVLDIDVRGDDVAGFFWVFNNVEIPDSDGEILVIDNVGPSDSGVYEAFVVLFDGTEIGLAPAIVDVLICEDVLIVREPENDSVCVGDTAEFFVQAEGDIIAYEWFFEGEFIPASNAPTLRIQNVSAAEAGLYEVDIITTNEVRIAGGSARLTVRSCSGGGGGNVVLCGSSATLAMSLTLAGLTTIAGIRRVGRTRR